MPSTPESRLATLVREAIDRLRSSAEGGAVLEAMMGGDLEGAIARLDWEGWGAVLTRAQDRLFDEALRQSSLALTEVASLAGAGSVVLIEPGADVVPLAQRWASLHAAELVTALTDVSRAAVRQVITSAVRQGTPMPDAARMLRQIVGLNRSQASAVANLRRRLVAEGRKQSAIARVVDAHSARMVRQRALTVARYEIQAAVNQGRLATFRAAAVRGSIGADAQKEWQAGLEPCPICDLLDGVRVVGIETPFPDGAGLMPPRHPRCRCTASIVDPGTTYVT